MAKNGGGESDLSSDDVQAIEGLHNGWIEAELAGNSALCCDCVPRIWCGYLPIPRSWKGKDAISQWLQSVEVKIKSLEISDLCIRGSGTVAYKTASYTTTYLPAGSSDLIRAKGTHLWGLKRVGKVGWRVELVTWSALDAN